MGKRNISILLILLLVFMAVPVSLSNAESGTSLVFDLNKNSFTVEEEIKGTGLVKRGDTPVAGIYATITVENESGLSLFKVGQYTTDNNGEFDVNFRLPYSMETGKYLIKVKALGKEVTQRFEISRTKPVDPKPDPDPVDPKPDPVDLEKPTKTVDEKKDKEQIKDEKREKIKVNMDSDTISVNIDSSIIENIIKNKKELEVSSDDFTLSIKSEVFEKNKEYPIELKIEKKDKKVSEEYIQVFPFIKFELNALKGDKVENIKLNNKATLSINYYDKIGLNYEKACIYRVDENDNLIFLGGRLNRDNKTIECDIDDLGEYVVLIYDKTFKDTDIAWAKDPIEVLASRYIVDGVDKDNFKPNKNITRAEFCKMIISALDVDAKDNGIKFEDVDGEEWYFEFINSAVSLGIVEGYDGKFKPNAPITREAMATMIYRVAKLEEYGQTNVTGDLSFSDSESISDWSKEAVLFAKENGITKGVGNNKFEPQRNATRAEAAVMVYKMLKIKGIF